VFVGVRSMIRFNVACLLGDWRTQDMLDLGRMLYRCTCVYSD
jgi:hypothetical protein